MGSRCGALGLDCGPVFVENVRAGSLNPIVRKFRCPAQRRNVMAYEVYLYTLPRVTDDGKKSILGPDSQKHDFTDVEQAKTFAAENKDKFDRVVLMENGEGGQKMVERYMDGNQS